MPGINKNERLKKRKEISLLYESGQMFRGKNVNVIAGKGAGKKAAFTAVKSCAGAVKRNFIKRRLREAYRRQKNKFATHCHYMFIGKAGCINCDFESLQNEIASMALKVAKHGSDSP